MRTASVSGVKSHLSELSRAHNSKVSRRNFLKAGAGTVLSFLGFSSDLHGPDISLKNFLQPQDNTVIGPSILFSSPGPFNPAPLNLNVNYRVVPGRRQYPIIWMWLGGGLSHLDTFCINPEAPEGIKSFYSPISTRFEGIKISEKLPLTARLIHQTALLRNIYHNQGSHELAIQRVFSSSDDQIGDKPKYTPYVVRLQKHHGADKAGYIVFDVSGLTYEGIAPGEALKIYKSGGSILEDSSDIPYRPPTGGDFDRIRHEGRMGLLDAIDRTKNLSHSQIDKMSQHYRTANSFLNGRMSEVFDLSNVPDRVRDKYGRTAIGNAALVAQRMIEAGAPQILLKHGWWDGHNKIKEDLDKHLPPVDHALSALITDLKDRAIIVLASEFGRTPRINSSAGRDHWPDSNCMLIAGPTILPCVVGKLDNMGQIIGPDREYKVEYMGPTILKAAGYELVEEGNTDNKMPYYPIFKSA